MAKVDVRCAFGVDKADNNNNNIAHGELLAELETLRLQPRPQPAPRLSLLGLPTELRLRIYDLIPVPILSPSAPDQAPGVNASALLLVSRQTYTEAKPILYANIEVESSYLKHVPTHALKHLRSIRILCVYDDDRGWHAEPALTQFNRTRCWPLENMWRYLGRALPRVRFLRLVVAAYPGKLSGLGEGVEARGARECRAAILPALQCVVVESRLDPTDAASERLAPLVETLKAEAERLSKGAVMLRQEGWYAL